MHKIVVIGLIILSYASALAFGWGTEHDDAAAYSMATATFWLVYYFGEIRKEN